MSLAIAVEAVGTVISAGSIFFNALYLIIQREKLFRPRWLNALQLTAHLCCIVASFTKIVLIYLQSSTPAAVLVVNSWTTLFGYATSAEFWLTLYSAFDLCRKVTLYRIRVALTVILVLSFSGRLAFGLTPLAEYESKSWLAQYQQLAAVGFVAVAVVGVAVCISITRKLIAHTREITDLQGKMDMGTSRSILAILFLILNLFSIGTYSASGFIKVNYSEQIANNMSAVSSGCNGLALALFCTLMDQLALLFKRTSTDSGHRAYRTNLATASTLALVMVPEPSDGLGYSSLDQPPLSIPKPSVDGPQKFPKMISISVGGTLVCMTSIVLNLLEIFVDRERLFVSRKITLLQLCAQVCCVVAALMKIVNVIMLSETPGSVIVIGAWSALFGYISAAEFWLTLYSAFCIYSDRTMLYIHSSLLLLLLTAFGGRFAYGLTPLAENESKSWLSQWQKLAAVGYIAVALVGVVVSFSVTKKLLQHSRQVTNLNSKMDSAYARKILISVVRF
ncbi:hypothetical protein EDD86DRAFT_249439 [Gorgonomyces haynaldii]|nr:hypothetical protein EDD86DRAFT_249439 [Gorgonomyces haynaldii]